MPIYKIHLEWSCGSLKTAERAISKSKQTYLLSVNLKEV